MKGVCGVELCRKYYKIKSPVVSGAVDEVLKEEQNEKVHALIITV